MFSRLLLATFCLILWKCLLAEEGAKEHCYDWEKIISEVKSFCRECKTKSNPVEGEKCINGKMEVLDENGNVVPSKIRDRYLVDLHESKVDELRDALKDCGKDLGPLVIGSKDQKTIDDVWSCCVSVLKKICVEFKEVMAPHKGDEDLKNCAPKNFGRALYILD